MDLNAVFLGLADAVNDAEIPGTTLRITATDFAPESPPIPAFQVEEFSIRYHRTMATAAKPQGDVELSVTAALLLSRGDDKSGQREARALSGTGSNTIIAAIEAARGEPSSTPTALGGAAEDCWVVSARGPRLVDYGDVRYYTVEFSIMVIGF
jgi:hypothetical protein